MSSRTIVAFVVVAIIAFGLWWISTRQAPDPAFENDADEKVEVNIAGMTWAGVGTVFVANEAGLFDRVTVNMPILDDTAARQAAYNSGSADIMITTADQFAREQSQGIDGQILFLSDSSDGGDGMVVSAEIDTVADLEGKRIGYTVGTAAEWLLWSILDSASIGLDEVKLLAVEDQSAITAAFNTGQIDAAVLWEPNLSETAAIDDARILVTSSDFPNTIVGVFVASDDFINDTDSVIALLDGWMAAVDLAETDMELAVSAMSEGFSLEPNDVTGMLDGLRLADRATHERLFCSEGSTPPPLQTLVEKAAEFWNETDRLADISFAQNSISPAAIRYFCAGN